GAGGVERALGGVLVGDLGHEPGHVPAGRLLRPPNDCGHAGEVVVARHVDVRLALVPQHGPEAALAELPHARRQRLEEVAARLPVLDAGAELAGRGDADGHLVAGVQGVPEGRTAAGALALVLAARMTRLVTVPT